MVGYVSKGINRKENRYLLIQQLFEVRYDQLIENLSPAHGGDLKNRECVWSKKKKIQLRGKS